MASKDKEPGGKNYLKYSGLAVQFVATILICVYLGDWLDRRSGNATPWFTLTGAIIGLVGSMIYLITRVTRDK